DITRLHQHRVAARVGPAPEVDLVPAGHHAGRVDVVGAPQVAVRADVHRPEPGVEGLGPAGGAQLRGVLGGPVGRDGEVVAAHHRGGQDVGEREHADGGVAVGGLPVLEQVDRVAGAAGNTRVAGGLGRGREEEALGDGGRVSGQQG